MIQRLMEARLITVEDVRACSANKSSSDSEAGLLQELQQRGLVTAWQLEQVKLGRRLFLENGRYLLLDELGRGGMGAVYRARHTRMNREVALKVIDPKQGRDSDLARRFRREIEVCARLHHEHIVQAFDVGQDGELTFLVLEYVHGSDLASLVQRDGAMSPGEVAAIGMQAASALGYAHAQGIVHRDIKPNNVLLSTAGVTKVLDLGLARIVEDETDLARTGLTQTGSVMGTVDYMPPEQARNTHAADARSDIYSLGATLYFLLTGRPPFPGGSTIEKLHRLATEVPAELGLLRPDCPKGLTDVIHRMLAKRPDERFKTAEDVVRALRPWAADRLAGRSVVTSAVQSAAETQRSGAANEPLMTLVTNTVATNYTRQQQRAKKGTRLPIGWWIAGGATLLALLLAALFLPARPVETIADQTPQSASPASKTSVPVPVAPKAFRRELPTHFGQTWCSEFSPDAQRVATGGSDADVRVWNVATGKVELIYRGHSASVMDLAWSHDGRRIFSRDYDGTIHDWDASTGARRGAPIPAPGWNTPRARRRSMALSPDGRELTVLQEQRFFRWDLSLQRAIAAVEFARPIQAAYSPRGDLLAVSGIGGDVSVFDTATHALRRVLPTNAEPVVVAFQTDGMLVAAATTTTRTFNPDSGDVIRERSIPSARNSEKVPWIRFSAIGSHALVAASDGPRLVNLATDETESLQLSEDMLPEHQVYCSFSGNLAAGVCNFVPGNLRPRVWEMRTGRIIHRLPRIEFPIHDINAVRVLRDRFLQLQSHGGGSRFATWDLHTGVRLPEFPEQAHVSSEGTIWGVVDSQVYRYVFEGEDVRRVEPLAKLAGLVDHWPEVLSGTAKPFRWTADGRFIFFDQRVWTQIRTDLQMPALEVFDPPLPSPHVVVWDAANGARIAAFDLGPEFAQDDVGITRASYDGSAFIHGYARIDSKLTLDLVRMWRIGQTSPAIEFPSHVKLGPAFTAITRDGRFCAAAAYPNAPIYVLRMDDGKRVAEISRQLEYNLHYGPRELSFSPSGRWLLGTHEIWDWEQGQSVWKCPEADRAQGPFMHCNYRGGAWLSDDDHVLIAQDASFQVWNWRTNAKLATLYFLPDDNTALVNHVTGHWCGSPNAFQYLRLALEKDGETSWLTDYQFAQRTGWKNDPEMARFTLPKAKP